MPRFIPALELNRGLYFDVVAPLMREHFPGLPYSAGLVGHGSDVLGFDSPRSTDHDWGPRLQLFFSSTDYIAVRGRVDEMLKKNLPTSYKGYSTHFVEGNRYLKHRPRLKKRGPVNHIFDFWTPRSFFQHYLAFDIERRPSVRDWLLFPQHSLLEISRGLVYHDDLGLEKLRSAFAWYPDDIWRYLMRVQWGKIGDELQYPARSGEAGDELGSAVIAARSVQKVIFMCFLMERRYVPYAKWLGTAFKAWLRSSERMQPLLHKILRERKWLPRQHLLVRAYSELGRMHNELNITPPVKAPIRDYYGRGYPAIPIERYIDALTVTIKNPVLRDRIDPLGSVDQFIDHARLNQLEGHIYMELGNVVL